MNTWGKLVNEFVQHVESIGFEKVLQIPFIGHDKHDENFFVYFHRKYGIVLAFDTFSGDHVNGGYYYYQWKSFVGFDDEKFTNDGLSSGGWREINGEWIWEGHGGCRENMDEDITMLLQHGTFITPWVKHDGIFKPTFVHYGDHYRKDDMSWDDGFELYKKACREKGPERMNMLPDYVQKAIKEAMWRRD
jgi:hypothetical protein